MLPPRQPIAALPPEEVEKICAGEVVERPLSVVKELIENALDAGATEVTVELEDGGRRLVRVSDDGGGIPADELALALKPHHTSKLRSLDDLYSLSTLGFRGEALSSIAAVSKLTLSSRVGTSPAQRISVQGGRSVTTGPCNLQHGTEVEVADLFYNVPARLKFLRSAQSETSQVSGLLTTYAIAYPEVRWTLRSGGRTLLQSDGDGDLLSILADLLGTDLAADLAPVDFEYPPSAVRGYISAPHRHWHNRARQWYLINRRPVINKLLYKAVDDAMREFVSPGKFPAGVLLLELPPEEIDVNVHPTKAEVSFAQPEEVYSLVRTAVRRALGQAAAERQRRLTRGMALVVAPAVDPEPPEPAPRLDFAAPLPDGMDREDAARDHPDRQLDPDAPSGQRAVPVYEMQRRFVSDAAPSPLTMVGEIPGGTDARVRQPSSEDSLTSAPERPLNGHSLDSGPRQRVTDEGVRPTNDSASSGALPFESLTSISQVADSYLVLATPGEVYLIDQHSAHERVLFEELWERLAGSEAKPPMRQRLLFPWPVALTPAESQLAVDLLPGLEALGFRTELDAGTLHVTEVPALLARRLSPELLAATLTDLAAGTEATALQDTLKYLASTLACKAAIKAGQPLPPAERIELARLITSRWSSLSCPHGRPTVVRLGPGELERMFLR